MLIYTSDNQIYSLDDSGNKQEIPCGRIEKYRQTLDDIRRRKEWKTSGAGAQFMGTAEPLRGEGAVNARITGLAVKDDRLIYGVELDESASIYHREIGTGDDEGLIVSDNDLHLGEMDCFGGQMAVSLGHTYEEYHIAVFDPPSSAYEELTDGDTTEVFPFFSRCHKGRIYFSASGNARDNSGTVAAVSPYAAAYIENNSITEFISDEKHDYLRIKDDEKGNLYYIRQPYEKQRGDGIKATDVLFFIPRLIKALFGWANFMSTIWGGESLKSGSDPLTNLKTKNRSAKDMYIDGNLIKAEEMAKAQKSDKDAGFMPLTRELVKREADGEETVLKRGVLDYIITGDSIIYSDGASIYELKDGRHKRLCKAYFAMNLVSTGQCPHTGEE